MQNLPKRLLIKTYDHPSGLLYLGLTLKKELEDRGHQVWLIPKGRIIKENGIYRKEFHSHNSQSYGFAIFDSGRDHQQQIASVISKYKAEALISLETLMESSQWIDGIGIPVIDVPMIEWVNPRLINLYNKFKDIWAVTDFTKETLNNAGLRNVSRVSWKFTDSNLFYPGRKLDNIVFYHQGSLNPNFSSKNTRLVISAFSRAAIIYPDISLNITGVKKSPLDSKYNIPQVNIIEKDLTREEVGQIYRESSCIIAPSSQEGLGLSLYEAKASGCDIITTNAAPMNEIGTRFLCEVASWSKSNKLVSPAIITEDSLLSQIKKYIGNN